MHTKFFRRVFSINAVFSPILTEKYICYAEQTRAVLAKLADHGKKMFLITNSPSSFVYVSSCLLFNCAVVKDGEDEVL